MPPGVKGTTFSRENCSSVATAMGRRKPIPLPLMHANIRSDTKYASSELIFLALTPGIARRTASICDLRSAMRGSYGKSIPEAPPGTSLPTGVVQPAVSGRNYLGGRAHATSYCDTLAGLREF